MANSMDEGGPGPAALLAAALQLHRAGQLADAERLYQQLLAIDPDNARALHLRGVLAYQQNRAEAAVDLIGRAIARNADEPSFHSNLGLALQACGRREEAVAAYGCALALDPTLADGHYNLGNALQELGRLDEAVASYAQALALRPDLAEAHSNLGVALRLQGRLDEAVSASRHALFIRPNYAEAQCNLGLSLRAQGKLEEAVPCFGQAIALKPNYADAYSSLGSVLVDQGKIEAAQAAYRRALALDPHHVAAHDALLLSLTYASEMSSEQILAEHLQFEAQHARALLPTQPSHANDRNPDRRLRIGYVSPDFRAHSVAWFLEPVLRAHDRAAVELFCYAELARADSVTAIMRPLADHWRMTLGLSDSALAAQIRADAIDILVDLAGHTSGNRLLVLARKPAPVQASWLGYPATTGLSAIDYRIVDAVTDPPGSADRQASETLLRLPGGCLCYRPARDLRPAAAPPSLASGSVTFGSFNNPAKLSEATLDGWARLLARLPDSRLLLKGGPFRDAATSALYLDRLVQRGVAAERVALIGWIADPAAHLTLYERVDIALDPFPYNGTTTSLEALSMGVPVVSLRGDRHAGRVGASLLGQVGLGELVADSVEAYIAIAAALAQKPQKLAALRRSLRSRMLASPLCDTAGFTRTLEGAYRAMWRRWCETGRIEGGNS